MITKDTIEYRTPNGHVATIPKGTEVVPATNLPEEGGPRFWAESWDGMGQKAESWARSYGFLLGAEEVEVGG